MIDVNGWTWVFDRVAMVCRNEEHRVAVKIEKKAGGYFGKLQDMPMDLFSEISKVRDGEKIIEMIVRQAENAARGDFHLSQRVSHGRHGGKITENTERKDNP